MYDVCNGVGGNGSSATLQVTVGTGTAGSPQGTSVGDVVVVCGGTSANSGGQTITGVTDSQGHTYAQCVSQFGGNGASGGAMWSTTTTHALVAGTDWIKITYSSTGGYKTMVVKGLGGASSSTPDQTSANVGTSTSPDAGATGVLAQASERLVGFIVNNNGGGLPTGLSTGGSGTTAQNGNSNYLTVGSTTLSSTASTDFNATLPTSANWVCLLATFKLSGSGLAVSTTTPTAGTVGSAYNGGSGYTLGATGGTPPYTWSIPTGPLPPGLALNPGGTSGHICGATLTNTASSTTLSTLDAMYTAWANVGLYTPTRKKIYFDANPSPTFSTLSGWKNWNNGEIGVAVDNSLEVFLSFKPTIQGTYNDTGWPGGAIFPSPATQATDYAAIQATINSLQTTAGVTIAGIEFYNEADHGGTPWVPLNISYLYYAYYPLLKRDYPAIPVYLNLAGYNQDATARTQRFPGPSPLQPNGWGTKNVPAGSTNSTNLFCDGIGIDIYGAGFDNMDNYSRNLYAYGEPDIYTPPTATKPASGLPGWADIADYAGVAFGWFESGNSVGSTTPPSQSTITNYLAGTTPLSGNGKTDTMAHSVKAVFQHRINNGLPIIAYMWYIDPNVNVNNEINSSNDYRVTLLNNIDSMLAAVNSGIINGTPTLDKTKTYPATYPITVKVTDKSGSTATASMNIVISNLTLAVSTTSLSTGHNGTAYSFQLQNNGGGTGSGYTWTLTAGSLSGSGISLSTSGLLSGSSPVTGTYSGLKFTVTDSGNNTATSGSLTLTISASTVTLSVTTTSLPSDVVGTNYSFQLQAQGGTGTGQTWQLVAGSLTGSGVSLSSAGLLSGAGSGLSAGTYSGLQFKVTDSGSNTATSGTMSLVINASQVTLAVTTTSLGVATAGQSYSFQLSDNGGGSGSGYTWTLNAGSLSGSGISLSSAGVLSGSSPVAGSYTGLQFKVTDSASNTALSGTLTLTVNSSTGNISITNSDPLPNATAGEEYVQNLNITGGTPPYTVTLVPGTNLPPGLVIDNNDPIDDQAGNALTDQAGGNLS